MLTIWALNVGHGDSIILDHRDGDTRSFALIDSNHSGDGTPRALQKLQELGAERLSFLALTHPHADHYMGLAAVLETYAGRISDFYTYPIGQHIHDSERLRKLANAYAQLSQTTDSPTAKRRALEFVRILVMAWKQFGQSHWHEVAGPQARLFPDGFQSVEIYGLLPLPKVKGYYFQMIEEGRLDIASERQTENELSIAFSVKYRGQEMILGGDGVLHSWLDHRRQLERAGEQLGAKVAKLPHHGSKLDCTHNVLTHLFGENGPQRTALISANGYTHPHPQTLSALEALGIQPYCTNLATQCGANVRELLTVPDAAPVLNRLINSLAEPGARTQQPCQGDIAVTIDDQGGITVNPQYDFPCPYRGGLDYLFAP